MHIRTNKTLNFLFHPILLFCEWLGEHHPKTLMRIRYFARFHRPLDLKHPKTLNEKILYLSLRTDTTLWTTCADKYAVREYVKSCGLEDTLVKLYGVWDKADEIDFSALPDEFVMKGTHGSGDILIIKNKNSIDENFVKRRFDADLKKKYGAVEAGLHYFRIKPRIIAEELLFNDSETAKYSASLIDYKIWCFNGKPHFIWTVSNRKGNHKETMVYDLQWNPKKDYQIYENGYVKGKLLPRPYALEDMIAAAEKLAHPFPIVRVDFYSIGKKIYFGELTFTSHGGLMINYTDEFQLLAGSMIDLSKVKTID